MTADRDPRIDPQADDRVDMQPDAPGKWVRHVMVVDGDGVRYWAMFHGVGLDTMRDTLEEWREAMNRNGDRGGAGVRRRGRAAATDGVSIFAATSMEKSG